MNITPITAALVGAFALIAFPSASYASPTSAPDQDVVATVNSAETDAALWALAGTQTQAEIAAIVETDVPRAELFDPIANEIVAVIEVAPPPFSIRAITQLGR